jgi:regulator of sirC expression with transglutaminase-like and TPR domain
MDPLTDLARALEASDDEIDLCRAALLVARLEYPDLDVDGYLGRLAGLADDARARLCGLSASPVVAAVLADLIHGEHGFSGNADAYYDPRNSYINDVLDRRLGIPISLSAIYLDLGRRLGLPLEGVGMPGHFLVRYRDPVEPLLLDPFASGSIVTLADCEAKLRDLYGPSARVTPAMLEAVGTRMILFRMLTNLKQIYTSTEDWPRARRTIDALLTVNPGATYEYRDRGMVRFRAGDLRGARADLDHYLVTAPVVDDAAVIREQMALIDRLDSMRN